MKSLARANTPLLPVNGVAVRKPRVAFCIGSKPASLILLWNFTDCSTILMQSCKLAIHQYCLFF